VILTGDHGEVIPKNSTENLIDKHKRNIKNFLNKAGVNQRKIDSLKKFRENFINKLIDWGLIERHSVNLVGHGYHVFDYLVKVPFILKFNDKFGTNRIFNQQIRQIDILPTLLDMIKIDYNTQEIDGESFMAIIEGQDIKENPAIIEAGGVEENINGDPEIYAVRYKNFKYIKYISENKEELYDLNEDPEEKNNKIDTDKPILMELKLIIKQVIEKEKLYKNESDSLSDGEKELLKERLKDLGYM
jgi:arylsulfatase A-like enzyme